MAQFKFSQAHPIMISIKLKPREYGDVSIVERKPLIKKTVRSNSSPEEVSMNHGYHQANKTPSWKYYS